MDAAAPTNFNALAKLPQVEATVRIVVDTHVDVGDGACLVWVFDPVSVQHLREHWASLENSGIVGYHLHGGLAVAAMHAVCDRDELAASRDAGRPVYELCRYIPYAGVADKFGGLPWGRKECIFDTDAVVIHLGTKIPNKDYCHSFGAYARRVKNLKSGNAAGELFSIELLYEGCMEQVRRLLPELKGRLVEFNGPSWGKGLDTHRELGPEADLTIHMQCMSLCPDEVSTWEAETLEVVERFVGWNEQEWQWVQRKIALRLKAQRLSRLVGRLRIAAAGWQSELRIRRLKRTIGSVDQDF